MIIGIWHASGAALLMAATIVSDGHSGPNILTEPGLFQSHVGSDVSLPCNITGLADLVLLWKQGSRIIFALHFALIFASTIFCNLQKEKFNSRLCLFLQLEML